MSETKTKKATTEAVEPDLTPIVTPLVAAMLGSLAEYGKGTWFEGESWERIQDGCVKTAKAVARKIVAKEAE